MCNLVNIERVQANKVSMIPTPVIEFFNKFYGVDVSGIKVVYEDMENAAGYYNIFKINTIHISNAVKGRGLAEEVVMVHEINHVLQSESNVGLTLNKDIIFAEFPNALYEFIEVADVDRLYYERDYGTIKSADDANRMEEYIDENYWSKHVEIDSRLAEAFYAYTQCGTDGVDILVEHVFKCGITQCLKDRINNMPNSMAKSILLDEYNRRKEEKEKNITPFLLTDEEFDLEIEKLLS